MFTNYIVPWGRYQGMRVRRVRGFHTDEDFRADYARFNFNPHVSYFLDAGSDGRDYKTSTQAQRDRWRDVLLSGKPLEVAFKRAFSKEEPYNPCTPETLVEYAKFAGNPGGPRVPRLLVEVTADKFHEDEAWGSVYSNPNLRGHLTVVASGNCFDVLSGGISGAHACIVQYPGCLPDIADCDVEDCYIVAWDDLEKEVPKALAFIRSDAGVGWMYTDINNTLNEITHSDLECMMKAGG